MIQSTQTQSYLALAQRSPEGSFVSPLLIGLVVVATRFKLDHTLFAGLLFLASLIFGVARHLVAQSMLAQPLKAGERLLTNFRLLTAGLGSCWGVLTGFAIYSHHENWTAVFTLLVMCGVAAGGSTSLAPDLVSLRLFLSCTILPGVIAAAVFGHYALLVVTLLFFLFLTAQGGKQNSWLTESINNQLALERQAEELRQAKLKAEEAAEVKATFLATMSHEIRTPLNGIIGMTELLLDTPMSEEQRDFAGTIQRSGESLMTVLNNVLDFSKLEARMMELEEVRFDLRAVSEEMVELLVYPAREKGLTVELSWHDELPRFVTGDLNRLRQVLLNLLANAVKFTEKGGVLLRVLPARDNIRFEVEDSGIGIPPERFDRLFQSFSQVDRSTSRQYGGTGLGLAICEKLVEVMRGRMGFDSQLGKGSIFWFELPLPAETPPAEPKAETRVQESHHDLKLLVVEDSPTNQKVMSRLLAKCGYDCDLAASGEEALEAVADHAYALVLMDCHMAGMDGITATEHLRKTHSAAELPIIAITASATTEDRDRCLQAGMNAYLTKPIRAEVLREVLQKHLKKEPA